MSNLMTPARFIREAVFGIQTQREFASLLQYEQATISRFENGVPFSSEAQRRIRTLAQLRKIDWDNNWFFEVPPVGRPPLAERAEARAVA